MEKEYIEFAGMNCDDCLGWDGKDRRCECGNRRVGWVCTSVQCYCFDDKDMATCKNAYAEAW